MIKATIAETGAVVGMAIWVAPLDRTETLGDLTEDEKKDEEFVKKAKEKGKEEREKAIETMIDGAFREVRNVFQCPRSHAEAKNFSLSAHRPSLER
jgi:hypothetical protein